MKRILLICLILLISFNALFAEEGVPRITKNGTSKFTVSAGALIRLPMDDGESKRVGVFGSLSLAPFSKGKFGIGFKVMGAAALKPSALKDLKQAEGSVTALCTASLAIAKSFEAYGGLGASYVLFDIKNSKDFSQAWGLALQGGARGRVTNHIGVGVEADFFKSLSKKTSKNFADIKAYLSVEI